MLPFQHIRRTEAVRRRPSSAATSWHTRCCPWTSSGASHQFEHSAASSHPGNRPGKWGTPKQLRKQTENENVHLGHFFGFEVKFLRYLREQNHTKSSIDLEKEEKKTIKMEGQKKYPSAHPDLVPNSQPKSSWGSSTFAPSLWSFSSSIFDPSARSSSTGSTLLRLLLHVLGILPVSMVFCKTNHDTSMMWGFFWPRCEKHQHQVEI